MNLSKFITAKLYNAMNTKQEKRQAKKQLEEIEMQWLEAQEALETLLAS